MKKTWVGPFWDGLSDLQRFGDQKFTAWITEFSQPFFHLEPEMNVANLVYNLFKKKHGKPWDKLREKGVQVLKSHVNRWYFIFWKYTK